MNQSTNNKGDEKMEHKIEWKKLMLLVTQFFELQNKLTELKIQDLSEYIEKSCSCPDCIMKMLTGTPLEDDEKEWQEFDDEFREDWE